MKTKVIALLSFLLLIPTCLIADPVERHGIKGEIKIIPNNIVAFIPDGWSLANNQQQAVFDENNILDNYQDVVLSCHRNDDCKAQLVIMLPAAKNIFQQRLLVLSFHLIPLAFFYSFQCYHCQPKIRMS